MPIESVSGWNIVAVYMLNSIFYVSFTKKNTASHMWKSYSIEIITHTFFLPSSFNFFFILFLALMPCFLKLLHLNIFIIIYLYSAFFCFKLLEIIFLTEKKIIVDLSLTRCLNEVIRHNRFLTLLTHYYWLFYDYGNPSLNCVYFDCFLHKYFD